jgi:hypothetical protein
VTAAGKKRMEGRAWTRKPVGQVNLATIYLKGLVQQVQTPKRSLAPWLIPGGINSAQT